MVVKYSTNKMFRVDTNKHHILFAHKDIDVPKTWLTPVIVKGPKNMIAYKAAHPLRPNDCLILAESLTVNKPGYSGTACILKEKSTGLAFGYTDAQNIRIAKTSSAIQNKKANPSLGEAYAIVRTEIVENEVPYHIAFVMFKDGDTNITMEADAGNEELEYPIFDIYDIGKNTFHQQFSEIYSPASTITLKKR